MKDFVPYQQSLELIEIGFNESCIATIDQTEYVHIKGTKYPIRGAMCYMEIPCPTFAQAFRFLERSMMFICIQKNLMKKNGGLSGDLGEVLYSILLKKQNLLV